MGRILLTGASGYVGSRLAPRLAALGRPLRCLARDPTALRGAPRTAEVVRGDLLDPESLRRALAGVECAYYLVHSMGAGAGFEERDRRAARNFAEAARAAGVRRIVYLGGLGRSAEPSPHLASRHEVGRLLRSTGVPVIELRASIVIGCGSLSFDLVRALVERLPVMITPRWVEVEAQPIAVDDLLDYLVACLDLQAGADRTYEIGGADVVSYGALMREVARQRGLWRKMIRVPVLTPALSSLWLGLVTPVQARVGRSLIESIRTPSVVLDPSALADFALRPRSVRAAVAAALREEERAFEAREWLAAFEQGPGRSPRTGAAWRSRRIDSRSARVGVPPQRAFVPIRRIGGGSGWYAHDGLWRLRGLLDRCVGGAGLQRGRRDPDALRVGDALDCWTVEAYEPDRLLRLRARMQLPGRAWLEFEVLPCDGGATIRQTALFEPKGLLGLVYWFTVAPLHGAVFAGMLRGIARRAQGGGLGLLGVV